MQTGSLVPLAQCPKCLKDEFWRETPRTARIEEGESPGDEFRLVPSEDLVHAGLKPRSPLPKRPGILYPCAEMWA